MVRDRGVVLVELRRNLERAQQKMRDTANKHRRDVQFEVGDKVLLKLQQYRQHSVAKPLSAKLARRFFGPLTVTERVGPVAYRLQLPQGARIHDVFHVSLLRPFVEGASQAPVAELPGEFVGNRPVLRPSRILYKRVALQGGEVVDQVLVDWSDGTAAGPSWEPLNWVSCRFPSLLEDKDRLKEGGVDTRSTPRQSNDVQLDEARETEKAAASEEGTIEEEEDIEASREVEEEARQEEGVTGRPRRQVKKPVKYGDFVSY